MVSSWEDLVEWVKRYSVEALAEHDQHALTLPTLIDGEQHAATIVWDTRALLVHVIQPLDVHLMDPSRIPALESAIVRINHVLVLPGFGYDHEDNRVYYRWVVPRTVDGIDGDDLDRAIRSVLETCRDFLGALRAVAAGDLEAEELLPRLVAARKEAEAAAAEEAVSED